MPPIRTMTSAMGWSRAHTWTSAWLDRRGPGVHSMFSVGSQLLWLVHSRTVIATAPSAEPTIEGQAYFRDAVLGTFYSLPTVRLNGPWGDIAASVVHQYARLSSSPDPEPHGVISDVHWSAGGADIAVDRLRHLLRGRFLPTNYHRDHCFEFIYLTRIAALDMLDPAARVRLRR